MKSQYQDIRNILDSVQYLVNPDHEAAFKALLLEDQRKRRRNLLLLALLSVSLLIAAYLLTATSVKERQRNVPVIEEPSSVSAARTKKEPGIASVEQEGNAALQSSTTQSTGQTSVLNQEDTQQGSLTEHTADSQNAIDITNGSGNRVDATSQDRNSPSLSTQNRATSEKKAAKNSPAALPNSQQVATPVNKKEPKTTSGVLTSAGTAVQSSAGTQAQAETVAQSEIVELTQLERTPATVSQLPDRDASDTELLSAHDASIAFERELAEGKRITPATRRVTLNNLHFGVTGTVFPSGQLFSKTQLQTGVGFQAGGYASYRLSPRTQVRADLGFGHLDGGFSYVKQSEAQHFGFSVLNQSNTLEVQKLYSAYLSTEIGLKRGKYIYCFGASGNVLYGAKGDIRMIEHSLDASMPKITEENNVWVSTQDMQRVSLMGMAGVRTRIARRIEVGGFLRIPLMQTVKAPQKQQYYDFSVQSHGISPQFSLSYQLNQQ